MELEKYLLAAQGYSELGMVKEALAELNAFKNHPDSLQMRMFIHMRAKNWHGAIHAGRRLSKSAPERTQVYLHTAFCLHELGKTNEAKKTLLAAPPEISREATYHYNLACYDAVLGNTLAACTHLKRSFEMDAKFRHLAAIDPDLKTIRQQFDKMH